MIMVKDLFDLNKNFKEIKVIGGENGIERIVHDIEIMEVPDGVYWVSKGDFIITTGYMFLQNQNSLENIIRILNNKQAAALGIKVGRFIDKIPEHVIQLADQLSFPILEIPVHLSYSDFIWSIVSKLLSDKNFDNFLLEQFRSNLQQLNQTNYSIENMLGLLNNYIEKPIILLSDHYQFIHSIMQNSHNKRKHLSIQEISDMVREKRNKSSFSSHPTFHEEKGQTIGIFPLFTPDQPLGFLCILDTEGNLSKESIDSKLISEICPYLAISILCSYKKDHIHYQSREEFFKNVILGNYFNKNMIKTESEYFRLPLSEPVFVWIMEIQSKSSEIENSAIEKVLDAVKKQYPQQYFFLHQKKIVAISPKFPLSSPFIQRNLQNFLKQFKNGFPNLQFSIGISKEHSGLEFLRLAYQEANLCLNLGSKIYGTSKNIYSYDDLILYHLLSEVSQHPVIINIYNSTIKPIKDFDDINTSDLFETLSTFIKHDFNISNTSKFLYIHRNTLYNRLEKIQEITGYNLENSETKLLFHLGLKIHDIYSIKEKNK